MDISEVCTEAEFLQRCNTLDAAVESILMNPENMKFTEANSHVFVADKS